MQDPLYLSPLTTCNRNVETLVQRHSCLRSLTSWAKCLRNAPCQCTAHATARADIRLFKSENFPRIRLFSILFKFALLSEYAVELKNFLSRWSAESRVFLSRCISRERSEDTLQRLLEKVNRVPLHEDFHFRVTNGQRAEVKRACTAKEYPCFPRPLRHKEVFCFTSVSFQQLQIYIQ